MTCEVRRATHLQDRTVGQSEWDEGKGLGSEERLERREVGKTEEDTSAARVCNERGRRRNRSKGRGRRGGEGLCWREAGGGVINMCRGGGGAVEKKFDVGSVTVRMGRGVGGEFLEDRQRDEGVRPRHRAREGRRLDRRGGKVKAVIVQTKGADKVRGVRRVRGESAVGQRLEWVRVGKARGLQRDGGRAG